MTDRPEMGVEGLEYLIPDVLANVMEQEANRPTACWPFFAERYVWGEAVFEAHFHIGRVGMRGERKDYIAVFERTADRNRGVGGRAGELRQDAHRVDEDLGNGHECAVFVRINEGVQGPQCVLCEMPVKGRWFLVPSLVRLKVFKQTEDFVGEEGENLTLPPSELPVIVVDGELKRPLVGEVVGSRVFEGDVVDEMVEGRAKVAEAIPDKRGEFGRGQDGRVQDKLKETVWMGVWRFWLVVTDKTIRLHIEKPTDAVIDGLKVFVRPTELAPLGHCLGLNR